MTANLPKYDESSIKVLKGLDGVRMRPAMYVGDSSTNGFHHLVKELLDNSTDEALSGEATRINVVFHKDGSVTVADDGRGIPVKEHPEEKIPTIDVVFTILHAGGKFDNTAEDSAFKISGGTHGVGASVVNALSTWLEVRVRREGKEFFRRYENGVPTQKKPEVTKRGLGRETGTAVHFMADRSIFKGVSGYDQERVTNWLRELAFLNPGVQYKIIWEVEGQEDKVDVFKSEKGLPEFLEFIRGKNPQPLIHEPIYVKSKGLEGCEAELIFAYSKTRANSINSYANCVNTRDGGVHLNAALDSLAKVITTVAENNGLLKNLHLSVCKSDIQEGLNLIVTVKVPEPEYEAQTKAKLNNDGLRKPLGEWMIESITKELKKDREAAKAIAEKIINSMTARDASEKARDLVSDKTVNNVHLSGKLADCTSKNPADREIYLVEGDSAGGTAKDSRDRKTQAVLPLKGKVLNVGKTTLNKALDNKEIASIVGALGIKPTMDGCDTSAIRYHKVILAADADSDGGHICCLLFSLFYMFMRQVIDDGYLYICDLPLYRVTMGGKPHYLKDDKALEEFKSKNPNRKLDISRFKGLGEMDVKDFGELAMTPSTRSLKQVSLKNVKEAEELITCLMGEDVAGRKEFLMKHLNFKDI